MNRKDKIQLLKDLYTGRKSLSIFIGKPIFNLSLFNQSELRLLLEIKKRTGSGEISDEDQKTLKDLLSNYKKKQHAKDSESA